MLLTTTQTVVINDLIDSTNSGAVFNHPTVNFDLLSKWDVETLRNSFELQNALNSGDITMSYNGENITDITDIGIAAVSALPPSVIHQSGRMYCYTNNRWVTNSDDNYGTNYHQWNENCGTGTNPVVEWEHMGLLLPIGRRVQNVHIMGTSNNSSNISDVEIMILYKMPNDVARWQTGIDNDAEVTYDTVWRDTWWSPTGEPAFSGNSNDMHARTIALNYTITDLGMLSMYMKPIGSISSTRYFRMGITWEIA